MGRPWKIVDLQAIRTAGKPGLMVVTELPKHAAGLFETSPRTYFIVNDTDAWSARGGHRHPAGGKKELIVAVRGAVEFDLHSADACGREVLEDPGRGLLIPNDVWHGVRLSPGAVLLSIASTLYAPEESLLDKLCACP